MGNTCTIDGTCSCGGVQCSPDTANHCDGACKCGDTGDVCGSDATRPKCRKVSDNMIDTTGAANATVRCVVSTVFVL